MMITPAIRDALQQSGFAMSGNFMCSGTLSPDLHIEGPVSSSALLGLDYPLRIGAFSHLNGGFIQNATIGRYCSFARDIQIGHGCHPVDWLSVSPLQYNPGYRNWLQSAGLPPIQQTMPFQWAAHTVIGSDVWLGNGVFVQDGLTIGHGAIVGAHAVVTKDVPPYAIVAGNPARLIRMRFSVDIIQRLLQTEWWRYAISDFGALDFSDIHQALKKIENYISHNCLKEFKPNAIDSCKLGTILGF